MRSVGRYLRRHHLGLLALFVALGGTAYAASQLPKNSVGSRQLKKGAVRTADIKNGAVKLGKIDKAAQDALRGQVGATGPQGAAGGLSSVVIRYVEFSTSKEDNSGQIRANCEPGEFAVGGGAGYTSSPGKNERLIYSGPSFGEGLPAKQGEVSRGWEGSLFNSSSESKTGRVYVVCAK